MRVTVDGVKYELEFSMGDYEDLDDAVEAKPDEAFDLKKAQLQTSLKKVNGDDFAGDLRTLPADHFFRLISRLDDPAGMFDRLTENPTLEKLAGG